MPEQIQTFKVVLERSRTFALSSLPQGSVLGPLKYITYTEDHRAVIEKHSVHTYLHVDDGKLNVHLRIQDFSAALWNMENCVYTTGVL